MTALSSRIDRPFGAPPDCRYCGDQGCQLCLKKKKKRNKYNVAPVEHRTVDGKIFDSLAEAKRYCQLKLLQKGGFIRQLELQPEFRFEIDGKLMFKYLADFRYFEGSQRVVEDCKGVRTPVYRIKKKIIEATHHVKIVEVA